MCFLPYFRVFVIFGWGWVRKAGAGLVIGSRWGSCVIQRSFIALFLVQPVFGPRQTLRPVVLVELSSPGLGIGLAFRIRRVPREICPGLPWPLVLIAHTSSLWLRLGVAPCGTIPRIAVPGPWVWGPYHQGRKSWALPSDEASDHVIIGQFETLRGGCDHAVSGTSVPSAAGVQLPLLGTSGT